MCQRCIYAQLLLHQLKNMIDDHAHVSSTTWYRQRSWNSDGVVAKTKQVLAVYIQTRATVLCSFANIKTAYGSFISHSRLAQPHPW